MEGCNMFISFVRIIEKIINKIYFKVLSIISSYQLSQFSEKGHAVYLGHGSDVVPSHIHCGHHVHIGPHASFMASVSHIYIGNYVTFGPNVTIRGGDHRIDIIGKHIYEVTDQEKLQENDKDVYIDDGVWCGCNVTILKGCHIGRGAVIAAASVVTKDVPPYAIVAGNPAKLIRYRFSDDQIIEHELLLKERNLL